MTDWSWSITFWQSFILGFSTSVLSMSTRESLPTVSYVFFAIAVFNWIVLSFLFFRRKSKSEKTAQWIYLLNILFCVFALGLNQKYWLLSVKPVELFFGYKILALMVAIQAPPKRWVGLTCLSFILIAPVVLLLSWSTELRTNLSVQEPWFTFTLIGSCFFVYSQKLKTLRLIHQNAQLETSVKEWQKFAHFLLGVQHLVNSPLQIIETAANLIRKKHPETSPLPQKIEEALQSLKGISVILSQSQSHLQWNDVKMSLSLQDLENEIRNLSQGQPPR